MPLKTRLNSFASALLRQGWSSSLALLAAPGVALAGPSGAEVIAGQIDIARPDALGTVITQGTDSAIVNWQQFSVGSQEYVQFHQPSASSVVLNRVIGGHESEILGALSANGRVFLINPRGVLFGENAVVDVGGLVASTLDISNEDFLAGRYVFTGSDGAGAVTNLGDLRATAGGLIWLQGSAVRNEGLIQARSIEERNGEIFLAAAGGSIEHAGILDAAGGRGGTVQLHADRDIVIESGASIHGEGAHGSADTDIRVVADGSLDFQPGAAIHGGTEGGFVELSGHEQLHFGGDVYLRNGALTLDPPTFTILDGNAFAYGGQINEQTVEGMLQAGNEVAIIATDSITIHDLSDNVLDGNKVGGGGGNLLLGIGSGSTIADFTRGTGNGVGSIHMLGSTGTTKDVIRVDGLLSIRGGSSSGALTLGGLMAGTLNIDSFGGAVVNDGVTATTMTVTGTYSQNAGVINVTNANFGGLLTLNGGAMAIGSGGVVNANGGLDWAAASTIGGPGILNIPAATSMTLSGINNRSLDGGITVNNNGTLAFANPAASTALFLNNNAILNNNAAGTVILSPAVGQTHQILSNVPPGTINNNGGTIRNTGAGAAIVNPSKFVNNAGSLSTTAAGGLTVNAPDSTFNGTLNASGNDIQLTVPGSVNTFQYNGILQVNSGTLSLNGVAPGTHQFNGIAAFDVRPGANLSFGSATFNVAAGASLGNLGTSQLNLSGVTLGGSGWTLNNSGSLTLAGTTLGGTLNNLGTLTFVPGAASVIPTINNNAGINFNGSNLTGDLLMNAGGSVTLAANTTLMPTGAASLNGGTFTINGGTALTINGGPFNWSGGMLAGAGSVTLGSGTFNFTGSGMRVLNGPALPSFTAAQSLPGGSFEYQSGTMNVSNTFTIAPTASFLLNAANYSGLSLGAGVQNNGLFKLVQGSYSLPGNGLNTHSGTFESFGSSVLTLNGTHNFSGTQFKTGSGSIELATLSGTYAGVTSTVGSNLRIVIGNQQFTGSTGFGGNVTQDGGTVSFSNLSVGGFYNQLGGDLSIGTGTVGGLLSLGGNSFTLSIAGSTINANGGLNWTNSGPINGPGTLVLNGTSNFINSGSRTISGATVVNQGILNIAFPGSDSVLLSGNTRFNNSGTIDFTATTGGGDQLRDGDATSTLNNSGTFRNSGSGTATVSAATLNFNAGTTLTRPLGGIIGSIELPVAPTLSGPVQLTNGVAVSMTNSGFNVPTGATLVLLNASSLTANGAVHAAGDVFLHDGTLNLGAHNFSLNGKFDTGTGTLTAGALTVLSGGVLGGSGTVRGAVVNSAGSVKPGNSAGALNIAGNFTQGVDGTLFIEIGGTSPGTQYDQLLVSGTATLGGILTGTLIDNFNPQGSNFSTQSGQSFEVLRAGTLTGDFNTINNPPGLSFVRSGNVVVGTTGTPTPTPTPTPQPSPTPDPFPAPGPEQPQPTPTPTPTPNPTPTPTPTPTPAPAPQPTPTPAPAPQPTPTPSPAPEPTPTPTPEPTPTPTTPPSEPNPQTPSEPQPAEQAAGESQTFVSSLNESLAPEAGNPGEDQDDGESGQNSGDQALVEEQQGSATGEGACE